LPKLAEREGLKMAVVLSGKVHIYSDDERYFLCGEMSSLGIGVKLSKLMENEKTRDIKDEMCPLCMAKRFKKNTGKLRYDLIPFNWIKFMAANFTYGQKNGYKEGSWRTEVKKMDYYAAAMRHLENYFEGIVYDEKHDSLHSLGIAAWNLLAAMQIDEDERKEKKSV
jgi:hypothetical protein